jgi:hypothetical protein
MPKDNGYSVLPIRMVWSTLCWGGNLNSAWTDAGAKVVAGSRAINFYPNNFGGFASSWSKGLCYSEAIDSADTGAVRTVVQTYLAMIHAPSKKKEWGGCPLFKTVLGDNGCAKDYFVGWWGLNSSEWRSGKSGKDNMNYSSDKVIRGNGGVSMSSKPTW